MKLNDHRERYFSDLGARPVLTKWGRKRYAYVYQGIWYRWGAEGFDLSRRKRLYILLESVSIALFAWSGSSASALNFQKAMAGCGLLSVIPFLLELRGVFGFCVSSTYMMETDCKSIDFRIVYGALVRAVLLTVGLGAGLIATLTAGKLDGSSLLTTLAYLLTIQVSATVGRLQHRLRYRTYKSCDGDVGEEC